MSHTAALPRLSHPVIGTDSELGVGLDQRAALTDMNDTPIWTTASLITYVPLIVPADVIFVKAWVLLAVGSAGNYDLGLYHPNGTRLVSIGSTATTATAGLFEHDITDTPVARGIYYAAMVCDDANCEVVGNLNANAAQAEGCFNQASTFPLPATATFACSNTTLVVPTMGFSTRTLIV